MNIGQILCQEGIVELNHGRATVELLVANTGDRPIQVGSHFHFFEVNRLLVFERKKAYGFRLDIPSGTSKRFEPGEEHPVRLVELGGNKAVYGLNDLVCGKLGNMQSHALRRAAEQGFMKEADG